MRVAVFTGSQAGPPSHRAAAAAFATDLARAGVGIVYGGGHVGLMGVVADAALAAGGEVVGVIPQHLVDDELAHPGLPRLEVVELDARAQGADGRPRPTRSSPCPARPARSRSCSRPGPGACSACTPSRRRCSTSTASGSRCSPSCAAWSTTATSTAGRLDALGVVAADGLLAFVDGYEHPARKWTAAPPTRPAPERIATSPATTCRLTRRGTGLVHWGDGPSAEARVARRARPPACLRPRRERAGTAPAARHREQLPDLGRRDRPAGGAAHGDRPRPARPRRLRQAARRLLDRRATPTACATCSSVLDIERATVVGHSLGGGIALQFAYQFPERCERLALVGSGGLGPSCPPGCGRRRCPGPSWCSPR